MGTGQPNRAVQTAQCHIAALSIANAVYLRQQNLAHNPARVPHAPAPPVVSSRDADGPAWRWMGRRAIDDPWLIPQPRLIEVAPAGSPPFVLSPGIAITISHRAELGERVAARQIQRALRGCGVDAPIVPQSGAGAIDRSILLAVRDRDEPAFGAAPALVSEGPDAGVPADPAHGGSAPPLPGQVAQAAKPPAATHATSSQEEAGRRPESPLAGATEAYTLIVEATRVTLWAAAPAGLARGVQTLCQLLAQARQRASGTGIPRDLNPEPAYDAGEPDPRDGAGTAFEVNPAPGAGGADPTLGVLALPALRIEDAPTLPWRGLLLDVSRGRVPTLQTLLDLVDRIASYKLNMLQLYVEHTFAYRSHPLIGAGWGALTAEEIIALDEHCRERYVELVPCQQSFGHLRRILTLPEYTHLAESTERWSLAPVLEGSYRLLDELYADHLACFNSTLLNVCSDETYDLGSGQSSELAAREGPGRLYLGHILRLHALAAAHGRTMMVWDDIFLHYPELTSEIPRDAILLSWAYEAKPAYPQLEGFAAAGLRQIVCPGTSAWNTLFPRLANARGNIRAFVRDGTAVGAIGMLLTDWGDGGHYNSPGPSLYPYAYAAAEGWFPSALDDDAFEHRFAELTFGTEAGPALSAIRLLAAACELPTVARRNGSRTVELFFADPLAEDRAVPMPDEAGFAALGEAEQATLVARRQGPRAIADETLRRMQEMAAEAAALLAPLSGCDDEAARTLAECLLAARQIAHAARRALLGRRVAEAVASDRADRPERAARDRLRAELELLKRELHGLRAEYQRLWLLRSKPEGIWISLDRHDRSAAVIDGWRDAL